MCRRAGRGEGPRRNTQSGLRATRSACLEQLQGCRSLRAYNARCWAGAFHMHELPNPPGSLQRSPPFYLEAQAVRLFAQDMIELEHYLNSSCDLWDCTVSPPWDLAWPRGTGSVDPNPGHKRRETKGKELCWAPKIKTGTQSPQS